MFCIWCDYGDTDGADDGKKVADDTAPVIVAFGGTLPETKNLVTNGGTTDPAGETVTVTVGGTITVPQDGVNNENNVDRSELDESIATVVVTGTDAVAGNVSYKSINSHVSYSTVAGENTSMAKTDYYYKVDSNYYPVYAYYVTEYFGFYTVYYIGYSTTDSADNVTLIVNGKTNSYFDRNTLYTKSGTDPVPASTTITITGKTVGTTYITVGGVRYTINVIAENLDKVTPITVEYWITNRQVTANNATSKTVSASDAYGENGVAFTEIAPAEGSHENNVMVYWKGTRLLSTNKQNTDKGNDKTLAGDDFTNIRYWNGKWSFLSTETGTWVNFNSTDQIVAYYLQQTQVTDEINTEVVDWGVVPHTDFTYDDGKFVLLDFAVKYESGELKPDSFPNNGKTIGLHCNYDTDLDKTVFKDGTTHYRRIGAIRAKETDEYEVYMITVTPTNDTKTKRVAYSCQYATSYSYDGTEKVIWVDDEANLGKFADENLHYTSPSRKFKFTVGGEPTVPGIEIYNRQGMLVTYYVRAKVTEDSLVVRYVDDTTNNEFYRYYIAVGQGTYFDDNIGLNNNDSNVVDNNEVVNIKGTLQYVKSDLKQIPEIGASFRLGKFTCVRLEKVDDPNNPGKIKEIILHYTFDNARKFVVDFGVPLHITATAIGLDENTWTNVTVTSAKHGTTEIGKTNGLTYKPTSILTEPEVLYVGFDELVEATEQTVTNTYQIYLYPATNVLYEENVITNPGTEWTTTGTSAITATTTQATEKLGEENLHGYDDYYSENTGFSGGSAYKATLDASKTATEYGKPLTFEFTGNGFDLISECGPQTGALLVRVYKDGVLNHGFFVDTYFTGDNTGIINSADANGVLDYQVPVVRDINLTHGTYKVEVYGYMVNRNTTSTASLYSVDSAETYLEQALRDLGLDDDASLYEVSYMDENSVLNDNAVASDVVRSGVSVQSMANDVMAETDATQYVYVDGIRVYHTIDVATEPEYTAKEKGVTYYDIYDIAKKSGNYVQDYLVYVEGEGNRATLENYHNKGPQNEIYLTSGNTLAFKLNGYSENQINLKSIQISARAVTEEAAFVDNGKPIPIATNTEMYYSVQLLTTSDTKEYYLSIKCPKNTDGTNSMLSIGAIKLPNGVTIAEATESVKADVLRRAKAQDSDEFIPSSFTVNVAESVKAGKRFYLGAQTSIDVDKLIVEYQGVEYEITPDNAGLVSLGVADVYTYSCGFKAPKRGVADSVTVTVKAHKAGTDDVYSAPVTRTVVVK